MQVHPLRPRPKPTTPKSWPSRSSLLQQSSHPSPVEYIHERVSLSVRVWLFLWGLALLLAVSNVVVLAAFSILYAQSDRVDSLLWFLRNYFTTSETTAFLSDHGANVAVGYGVLACLYACVVMRICGVAIARSRVVRKLTSSVRRVRSTIQQWAIYCPIHLHFAIHQWSNAVGVRSASFHTLFLIEEWLELTTQTIAAYSASRSISNTPLNLTYAVVIFVNSVSAAITTRVFSTSLVKQRLSCVVTDLVLDFVWGTLLPLWMYIPVLDLYTHRSTILEDLTSYSSFTRQVERIVVVSWQSYLLSIVPFVGSLLKLVDLQSTLRDLAPTSQSHTADRYNSRLHIGFQRPSRLARLAHALLPVYGLGILLTSLAANEVFTSFSKQVSIPCGFRVHPWFATDEACLRRQLNCSTLGITGDAEAFTPMLTQFDSSTLSELHILDCPALEMPSAIRNFPNLMSIVILNSTVVAWDSDALLSGTFFHDLRNVQLYSVSFSENDPVGFTGLDDEPLAPTLEWIHLQDLDGTRILPLVRDHWRQLQAFECMGCGLTALPTVAYTFEQLLVISLAFNDIEDIPDDWPSDRDVHLQMMWLDGNPRLSKLPDSLWRQAATCGVFSAARTNLSRIPEWVADVAISGFQVAATGTPLCASDKVSGLSPRTRAITLCDSVYEQS